MQRARNFSAYEGGPLGGGISRGRFPVACLLSLFCAELPAAPAIRTVVPLAILPRGSTEVTLHGEDLAQTERLWIGAPARIEILEKAADSLRARVVCDSRPRIAPIRAIARDAVSAPALVALDPLPTLRLESGQASGTPPLEAPCAVEGAVRPYGREVYRFAAKAGVRVGVEILARRLGSPLDPLLRVLTPDGSEAVWCDDTAGLEGDCRISFLPQATGLYTLEVRDARYGGGETHRYRLRLGFFPDEAVAWPPALRPGRRETAWLLGREGFASRSVFRSSVSAFPSRLIAGLGGTAGTTTFVPLRIDARIDPEEELNGRRSCAQPLSVPARIYGRLSPRGDSDWFVFANPSARGVRVRIRARSLGSPAEIYAAAHADGGRRFRARDVRDRDGAAVDCAGRAGERFFVEVRELTGRGGPHYAYILEITEAPPAGGLDVEPEALAAAPGEPFRLTASLPKEAPRDLLIRARNAEGEVLGYAQLAKGARKTVLEAVLPEDAEAGTLVEIEVLASSAESPQAAPARASTRAALRRALPRPWYPPSPLGERVSVFVRARTPLEGAATAQ